MWSTGIEGLNMKLYLGVWQNRQALAAPQFMFSLRRLKDRQSPAPFEGRDWIMDSGAFSEITINGKYTYTTDEYLHYVEMHQPGLYFNMDFMCEPFVLEKTGGTVKEHQQKSIDNQIKIMDRMDHYDITGQFAGCIQGWELKDYIEHIDMLKAQGCITSKMGVGSVCRRKNTGDIVNILQAVKEALPNVKLHGFGIKTQALQYPSICAALDSSDSMAWSFDGRREETQQCGDCIHPGAMNCANCHVHMLKWYDRVISVRNNAEKQRTLNFFEAVPDVC
jgi:hypothetical protein